MIHIVTDENRELYALWLDEMFAQRKRVFVDEMGWALSHVDGREMDAFDRDDAVYLLHIDEKAARLKASARLLPTIRPHLLGDVFSDLCVDGVPWGSNIWEGSRFCPAPGTPKGDPRRHLLSEIIAAIMETGLIFNIERLTFVASAALAPLAMNAGWSVKALGPRVRLGQDRIQAFIAEIDAPGLKNVRAYNGLVAPLIRFAAPDQSAELEAVCRGARS